ncbi:MAG: carboxymuconolactone decarboxylase family protein [Pseudomonadota bacterium]|nr:carboxymuconolactone decarboxylase family protein [Pseudomonadota bacterium]
MTTASRRLPRLEPLTEPFSPETEAALAGTMPPGVPPIALFRVVARSPRVMARLKGGNLLDRGALALRQREILILRTTARCRAEHEWGVHVRFFAAKAGFSDEQVTDTANADTDPALWSEDEMLLIALADSLHDAVQVGDALWVRLRAAFDDAILIEAVAVCGFYRMISGFVNAFQVPNEAGAPLFPEPVAA